MKLSPWIGILITLILSSAAFASTPHARAVYYHEITLECVKVSGLKGPKSIGRMIEFDDRAGYSVLLLQGQYPQKHMRGQIGRELCLYNRRDKTAYVSEADSLTIKGK